MHYKNEDTSTSGDVSFNMTVSVSLRQSAPVTRCPSTVLCGPARAIAHVASSLGDREAAVCIGGVNPDELHIEEERFVNELLVLKHEVERTLPREGRRLRPHLLV